MSKRLLSLIIGTTISSFSIVCVIKAGLGCFSVTACNMAISNWLGISLGTAGFLLELVMLLLATKLGEGIGITSIFNATYGSIMIDIFNLILPTNKLMILFLPLVAIGWALMGKASFGDTGSNILMNALLKKTNKSLGVVRGIQEFILLLIGYIGARNNVTIFTLILSLCLGYLLQYIYKAIKYDPKVIKHTFLIRGDNHEIF